MDTLLLTHGMFVCQGGCRNRGMECMPLRGFAFGLQPLVKEDCTAYWGLNRNQMNAVNDSKLCLELASLYSASYEEDLALRDNTKCSSNSDPDRATHIDYYGENCWKGSVGIQLCGWTLVGLLWGGG
eukprot:scaffold107879_cov23-Cyclotella_meneghiniana.AAC.1